ncbi:hypothetical protein D9615_008480 [Tricholomella constricta]|uniref:Integrase catalytic domain-containing protein n=1 Tax=Tricholomella constricta TaxID=117010 RepID=A0A8H5H3Y2_9AGAR|nr:hypothetical protein D9615_008480 [Tricholomella constricta]
MSIEAEKLRLCHDLMPYTTSELCRTQITRTIQPAIKWLATSHSFALLNPHHFYLSSLQTSSMPSEPGSISHALETIAHVLEAREASGAVFKTALRLCQSTLDAAQQEIQRLAIENTSLKAAAAGPGANTSRATASTTNLAWVTNDTLLPHAEAIISLAKQMTIYHALYIPKQSLGIACPIPILDEAPELKYASADAYAKHIAYVLYIHLPEKFHPFLKEMPAFKSGGRSALVTMVLTNVDLIFNAYSQIPLAAWKAGDRKDPMFRRLLCWDDELLKPATYPPLIYTDLKKSPANIFCHPALIKIAHVILFGKGGLKGSISSSSNGVHWGRQKNLFGLISLCATLAIFVVSDDTAFRQTGIQSKIQYSDEYLARKRFLEKNAGTANSNALLAFWSREVYAGVPGLPCNDGDMGEEFDFDSAETQGEEAMRIFHGDSVNSLESPDEIHGPDNDDNLYALTPSSTLPSISLSSASSASASHSADFASHARAHVISPAAPAHLPQDPVVSAPRVLSARAPVISASDSDTGNQEHSDIIAGIERVVIDDRDPSVSIHGHGQPTRRKARKASEVPAPAAEAVGRGARTRNQCTVTALGHGFESKKFLTKKFRIHILKSMPKSWSVLTGSLFTETTSAAIITRLTTHAMLTTTTTDVSAVKNTQALSAQAGEKRTVRHPELKCTNLPACGRTGHTADQCFRPGGGMAGQYPEWWKGSKGGTGTGTTPTANSAIVNAANSATITASRYLAFSVSDRVSDGCLVSYVDSAASRHFFVNRADFETYEDVPRANDTGTTASGGAFTIQEKGRVRKYVELDGKTIELTFDDALHAPHLEHNLISIGCLGRKGCTTMFDGTGATFCDPTGQPFMRGKCHDETMYRIDFVAKPVAMSARSLTRPADVETWHRRLGHVGESILREMVRSEMVKGLDVTKLSVNGRCEDCIMGKQTRRPFDEEVTPESKPNQRVSFDLWGPAHIKTTNGKHYMMLGCDQGGAGVKGWFLADKTMETTGAVLEAYHVESERQTGKKLLAVRTDEGPEFINSIWSAYTTKFGIKHETTAPHSSAANGVVERMNRTILDRGRSMINDSGLPAHYWGEAMATAIHVSDFILSSRHAGKTPHEIREGRKPDVAYLRPFGCVAYAKVPKEDGGSKLDMRSIKGVLIGYFGHGDYKILDRSTGHIFRSHDIIFEEGRASRTLSDEGDDDGTDAPIETADRPATPAPNNREDNRPAPAAPVEHAPAELRRSTRTKTASAAALDAIKTEEAAAVAAAKGLDWARENKKSTRTALSAIANDTNTDDWLPKGDDAS